MAAPVIDASVRCRAALIVSGPSYRVAADDLPRLAGACVEWAAAIGSQLAGSLRGGDATADETRSRKSGDSARKSLHNETGRSRGND